MRELRYFLELSDGSHRDESSITYAEAEALLKGMDWKALSSPLSPSCPLPPAQAAENPSATETDCPFMLFLDPAESFFMIMPEVEGLLVTARVLDKWNLLGMMEKEKSFTLNFGVLGVEDALRVLKLFFEDKYPAMRSLEKAIQLQGP
jgi:hypothetical protein